MMFCTKCGNQLPEGAIFCNGCGNAVNTHQDACKNDAHSDGSRDTNSRPPENLSDAPFKSGPENYQVFPQAAPTKPGEAAGDYVFSTARKTAPLFAKVIAGVVAAAIIIGGGTTAWLMSNKNRPKPSAPPSAGEQSAGNWQVSQSATDIPQSDTTTNEVTVPTIEVDISNQGITNERLAAMIASGEIPSNVTHLYLGSNRLDMDRRNKISDFSSLQSLSDLTYLNLGFLELSDLSSLRSLSNLTVLNLWSNQISDLSPLQSLTKLTRLDLMQNQVSDLSPLQSLTNLKTLYLTSNAISDISPLKSLSNLTALQLGNNQILDISPLQSLTKLTMLGFECYQDDITPLRSLKNLTELELSLYSYDIDISPLQALSNLKHLSLNYYHLYDISPLQGLTNLEHLVLSCDQLNDISPIQSLTNLTELDLYSGQLSDLSPLRFLTNLTVLRLGGARIIDITPLQYLTNLTELSIGGFAQVSDISSLRSLINLTNLTLDNNQISDVSALQPLTNLTYLSLIYNQISDVTPLYSLTNLTTLYLDGNPLSATQEGDLRYALFSSASPSTEQVVPDGGYQYFKFEVEDVFTIHGDANRPPMSVGTGVISEGTVNLGQQVDITKRDGTIISATVIGIEAFRVAIESATVGDSIGLGLTYIPENPLERGDIVTGRK